MRRVKRGERKAKPDKHILQGFREFSGVSREGACGLDPKTLNQRVAGSNPASPTNAFKGLDRFRGGPQKPQSASGTK